MKNKNTNVLCQNCNSKNTRKHCKRKNKHQTIQIYFCKDCKKYFSNNKEKLPSKTYPTNLILKAVSFYNIGYSQQKVSKLIEKKQKINVSQTTISQWINEFKNILPYNKIREQCKKLHGPDNIIESYTFLHNNLPYTFQIHKAKLYHLFHSIKYNNQFYNISKFYEPLKTYLQKIPTEKFPHHIFKEHKQQSPETAITQNKNITLNKINNKNIEQRASQLKFSHLKIKKQQKNNLACRLSKLALQLATTNKDRHNAIQNFMLINDSTTIAVEIPVYLTHDDILYFISRGFKLNLQNHKTPITGHIDLLQIRNGLIHILDYKPKANKINPIEQLALYALALASRTKLALSDFKVAWFDENNYYELFSLHAVYEKKKCYRHNRKV